MRASLSALITIALGLCACSKASPEQEFSEAYARSVERILAGYSAEVVGPLEVRIRRPDGEESTAFLNNAFRDWKAYGGDQEELFARYRVGIIPASESGRPPLTPEQILPVIRNKQYLDSILQMGDGDLSKSPVYEPLNEELFVFYVQDTPDAIHYLLEEDLNSVQFSREARRKRSLENLRAHFTQVAIQGGNGFFMLAADSTYESSLLLSDNVWSNDALQVKGELIVAVPARDLVLVTGSDDDENLDRLREIVAETDATASHLISTRLFVRRDGRWEIFE